MHSMAYRHPGERPPEAVKEDKTEETVPEPEVTTEENDESSS